MFGRRKKQDAAQKAVGTPADPEAFQDDLDEEDRAYEDALLLAELDEQDMAVSVAAARPTGPWDVAEAPEPADGTNRLDLGGLLVPVPPGTELRVDVSPDGLVVAATIVSGDSALQVNAFAAPKTEGIWAAVRTEIAQALVDGGGQATEVEGPFGTELHATVLTEVPGEANVLAPARFLGVDGPRWFLRGLLTGPAATDPGSARELETALREVVVVRGTNPMAVRDALPLRLPAEVAEQAGDPADDQAGDQTGDQGPGALELPERGPEITEVR